MSEVRTDVLDPAPAPAPLCSDYAGITELRSREPEAIGRALAARRRRPAFLPPDGRLMLIAADHPARGALAAQGRPTAMHSRTEMLDRLRRRWRDPGSTACWPPPTSPRTCCCSGRWRTRSSSPR